MDGPLYRKGPPTRTSPRLMTTRAAFPPMRYPRWRYEGTPRITRSANFPGSKLPTWSPNPIACAELIVAATTASDGSRPLWWHASAIVSCVDSDQQLGLKSVPRATATPAAISRRPSANGRWETKDAAGSKTPTTVVRARASIPAVDEWSRWSDDAVPRSGVGLFSTWWSRTSSDANPPPGCASQVTLYGYWRVRISLVLDTPSSSGSGCTRGSGLERRGHSSVRILGRARLSGRSSRSALP